MTNHCRVQRSAKACTQSSSEWLQHFARISMKLMMKQTVTRECSAQDWHAKTLAHIDITFRANKRLRGWHALDCGQWINAANLKWPEHGKTRKKWRCVMGNEAIDSKSRTFAWKTEDPAHSNGHPISGQTWSRSNIVTIRQTWYFRKKMMFIGEREEYL